VIIQAKAWERNKHMLFAEIGLTIWAWRRGWKGWALLPMAVSLLAGIFAAFVVGASGGSVDDVSGFGLVLDLVSIGVLIYMGARGRTTSPSYRVQSSAQPQESAPEATA
jgi:hypothetical protein